MKNLQDLKKKKEEKISLLIKNVGMFFAFSNQQFEENKTALEPGEKYVHLGAGAYMPKNKVDLYLNGVKQINKEYNAEIKAGKLRAAEILYELQNHEAFYTCDIEDTLDALGPNYTAAEVQTVYNENYNKQKLFN